MKTYLAPAIKVIVCDSPYTDMLHTSVETYEKDPYSWMDQIDQLV